jgi:hypothetical protein
MIILAKILMNETVDRTASTKMKRKYQVELIRATAIKKFKMGED